MESDGSESINDEVKRTATSRKRQSLFLPLHMTVSEPTKTLDEEYLKKLESEEETWHQLYKEQQEQNRKLLKELKMNKPQLIDYSLFDEEEITYINAGPDVAKFVKEAEELQNMVKTVRSQCEAKRQKYNLMLEHIENSCLSMTSTLNR